MKSPFKDKPNIRRYSIMPARAMQDESLGIGELRVLACLGMYANQYGVCWPSQMRISQHIGVKIDWVSKCVGGLIKKGYVRKLEPRKYRKGIKRRSGRIVNRYQVLWEGNDPLPTLEQFWAPQPKFAVDPEDDAVEAAEHKQEGVKGDANNDCQVLAHAFRTSVERTCGVNRLAQPSFQAAKVLHNQGVTVDQVRDYTAAFVKEALRNGRTHPLTLDQVAKWAGLYKK